MASLLQLAVPAIPMWDLRSAPPRTVGGIAAAQERILARILSDLRGTVVAQRYPLHDAAAFRANMPILQYADLEPEIDRVVAGESDVLFKGRPVALAQTSGTTRDANASERYIPQTAALLRHHRRGGSAALVRVLKQAPDVLGGRMLFLGGCTALDRRGAVPVGDLSGIAAATLPRWISASYEPGNVISAIPDWNQRLDAIAAHLRGRDVRLMSGIPAWLLMLLERIDAPLSKALPNLRAMIHGGHAVEPFIATLSGHLSGDTLMQEVYPASEAFIAVGRAPWRLGDGTPSPLELLTNHGVYLEFAQDDGRVVGAHELQPGGIYRVLVTTPAGLLRYQVGDLIRAEGPGLMRFAGRVKTRISVFGEHVEGMALAAALQQATRVTGARVAHYHVAPILPGPREPRGAHEWWVEFASAPADPVAFTAAIDASLRAQVIDYAAHRDGGQLLSPVLRPVPGGTFHAYLAAKGHLGGQHKVPQAWPDRTIADHLAKYSSAESGHNTVKP